VSTLHGASRAALCALAIGLVVLAVSSSGAVPAWAHASLVSSSPKAGAELVELPSRVTFTFSEDVSEPAYVVVRTDDGTGVTAGDPVVEGTTVTQRLDDSRGTGSFTMAYRVVSVDGHPVTGELDFTVTGEGAKSSAEPRGEREGSSGPSDGDTAERSDDGPDETSAGTARTSAEPDGGFWSEHGIHYAVGGVLLAVALALLLAARGRSG
jgi:copper resistance protein C